MDTATFRLAVLGLVVYTAAFVCERSGPASTPCPSARRRPRAPSAELHPGPVAGRTAAGFRAAVLPLTNVLIALTKNTTVAAAIGVAEAALLMKNMVEKEAQLLLISAIIAFGFCLLTCRPA